MTMLRERRYDTMPAPVRQTAEWVTGVIGALAATIGAWMYYGPENGQLSLFGWDWNVAELSEAWPFGLLVFGGFALFAGFGVFARKLYFRDGEMTSPITASGLLSAIGAVVTVVYLLMWIF